MAVNFTRQTPTWADGHVVLAEDAERWESLGADTATWSSQVDAALPTHATLARRGMPSPCYVRTAMWAGSSGSWSNLNRLSVTIVHCSEPGRVVSALRYFVTTAGSADSVFRYGFYNVNANTWRPTGTPIRQGTGTANESGQHEVTLSPTLSFPSVGVLAFAAVSQGTTAPQIERAVSNAGAAGWYGTDGNASVTGAYTGNSAAPGMFHLDNVTGALPDLTGVNIFSTYDGAPLVALRFT